MAKSLAWSLKPNTNSYYKGAQTNINPQGFRDHDLDKKRAIIAVAGRSISFGSGIDIKDTWVNQLETRMNTEIGNFSVPAYTFYEVFKNIEYNIIPYSPKLIILPLSLSEWNVNFPKQSPIDRIPDSRFIFNSERILGRFFGYHFVRMLYKDFLHQYIATDWKTLSEENKNLKGYTQVSRVILKIAKLTKKHNIQLTILVIPEKHKLHPKLANYNKMILKKLSHKYSHIHLIYIEGEAKNLIHNARNTIYYGDPHFDKIIHTKMAKELSLKISL